MKRPQITVPLTEERPQIAEDYSAPNNPGIGITWETTFSTDALVGQVALRRARAPRMPKEDWAGFTVIRTGSHRFGSRELPDREFRSHNR